MVKPDVEVYSIIATSPSNESEARRVLKHDDCFLVCDAHGDAIGPSAGLYCDGTRFLSHCVLRIGGVRPLLLGSSVKEDNTLVAVDLTNPDLAADVAIAHGSLHVFRAKLLWQSVCYESIRVTNFAPTPVRFTLSLSFDADYADIFEVRGNSRRARGQLRAPQVSEQQIVLGYEGLDKVSRQTRITLHGEGRVSATGIEVTLQLEPHASAERTITIACDSSNRRAQIATYAHALRQLDDERRAETGLVCRIRSSNGRYDSWLRRSWADLEMLTTRTEAGDFPYAGIPWYSTPFGRDALITALECLWLFPAMSRGVLGYLAANQAETLNEAEDAEPGKILHEARRGEMAALGEVPFARYFGTIDATPLFVMLAGRYLRRTGDRAFIARIADNIARAVTWIERYGDRDGDGFVEYERRSHRGLLQQGWKDSHDSVFHADGSLARGPIALCEVQAYVYEAYVAASEIARELGQPAQSERMAAKAQALKARFTEAFWCEDLGTFALALDGDKRPCRVRSSNAGQVLLSGLASTAHARRVESTLMHDDSFCGWGIRTVACSEARYNPMSYHNGSVWPHDNALIAQGFARYRFKSSIVRIIEGLFAASVFADDHRLPELFCGFARRPGRGPTNYPVACSPQAWSAAAAFSLLASSLGLEIDALNRRIALHRPELPHFLKEVRLSELAVGVGDEKIDLVLYHYPDGIGIDVPRGGDAVEVVVYK